MSKYNDGSSIPIDDLSNDELALAIKEWAEGNPIMEKLLWNLYNKGIKTSGCHSGINPYVDFKYDPSKKEEYIKLMNIALTKKGSQVLITSEGSNPFSGPEWYMPTICLGIFTEDKTVVDDCLTVLNNSVTNDEQITTDIDTSCLMTLLDFFKEKLTRTLFRIRHNQDGSFVFSVENSVSKDHELYKYFNETLLPLGFTLKEFEEGPHKNWEYTAKDIYELNKIMAKAAKVLLENYSYKTPTSVDETQSFTIQALIMRKQLSQEDFKEWALREREKRFGKR